MDKTTMAQDRFQMMLEIITDREAEIDKKLDEMRAIEKRIKQMSFAFLKVINSPQFSAMRAKNEFSEE